MSSLVAASFVMGAGMAKAQTVSVPFNGTINATCAFGAVTDGVLAVDAADLTLLTTTTPGSVPITCNGGVELTVAAPVADPANPTATLTVASEATLLGETADSAGLVATIVAGPIDAEDVEVTMTATGGGILAQGDYAYTVDVTAVPQ
ncbi:hypothetical protein [Leptolyngbya sp. BL0902]|uniref:hypothetical protein n=1 Tax=Leptolyngbya sp. BL0902 TaxID=1115757 RepID=UPI0018E8B36A|nr:hypothetical protein [Leptolyngbya sp. BL0902]